MSASISPFRLTSEDMPDLDKKTSAGLSPLLDALNVSMQQVVAAFAQLPTDEVVSVSLTTDSSVAASFPLTFKTSIAKPTWIGMVCIPKDADHDLTLPFVMQGFGLTDAGLVSVPWITNLLALNTYQLSFLVR